MNTGYDIANRYAGIIKLVDEGDISPEQAADTIEGIEGELADKVDAYMYLSRDYEGKAERCEKESSRQKSRAKMFINESERFRELAKRCIETAGLKSLKTDNNTFNILNGKKSVVIENLNNLPDEFVEAKPLIKPKTDEIKAALESGREVPGAKLQAGEPYLQVR